MKLSFRKKNDRGAVLVFAVPALVMAIVACALGIDIGRIALDKKNDQNIADIAALDAARAVGFLLGSTTEGNYTAAAQTAALATAARNGFVTSATNTVTAAVGSLNASYEFVDDASTSAVQVTVTSYLDNAFMPGGRNLSRTAVANVGSPIAAFSVGSSLANLDTDRSRLGPVLTGMLGASGNISAVSYTGVAGANLSLRKLQTQLLALGLDVGSTGKLLTTNVQVSQLLTAMAAAMQTDGTANSTTAATEILNLKNALTIANSTTIKLGDLINLASPSHESALDATLNAYQLLVGSAQLVNKASGSFVTVPMLTLNTGVTNTTLEARVIEPAKIAIGPVGTTASNAQVQVRLGFRVSVSGLVPIVPTLINISLTYSTASALGTLSDLQCGASPLTRVAANTSLVSTSGSVSVLGIPISLTGSAVPTGPTTLTFTHPSQFVPTGPTQHTGATSNNGNINFGSVTLTGALGGLGLVSTAVNGALTTLNGTLAPVITPVLRGLGIDLAGVDVAALGIFPDPASCGGTPSLAK